MADFSFLSESDDSAVEDLVAQAIDLSVLEQVAAINCSGISDSVLPTDLETRFRKLKSFPGTNPKHKTTSPCSNPEKKDTRFNRPRKSPSSSSDEKINPHSQFPSTESLNPKTFSQRDGLMRSDLGKKSPDSSSVDGTEAISPPAISNDRKDLKSKSTTWSVSSPASSDSVEAFSPPRQVCCFWCSPKRVSRKKGKKNRMAGNRLDTLDWGNNDEILSDLTTFSLKDQRMKLKKALKEEEKVTMEAKKVVEWAKQVSARMDVSAIQDVLSDDERFK